MKRGYDFLGTHCVVETNDPVIVAWLDRLLWRFASDSNGSSEGSHLAVESNGDEARLWFDGFTAHSQLTREEAAMRLLVELNRITVSNLSGFGIHAGVVVGPGGAVLLPGGSGAGKSTLTAAFAVMGLDYLTDEIALFTDDGLIRPFPKPLWLSSWSRQIFGIVDDDLGFVAPGFKAAVTPEDVGVGVATGDAVLGCVVLITRSEGTEIEEVRPSQGVAALMSSTYHLANRCVEAFYLATRAVRNSTVLQLRVDDPLKAAESLIGVLA